MTRDTADFYTKEQAAAILNLTVRQVTNLLKVGKLRKVFASTGRKIILIPKKDVDDLYLNGTVVKVTFSMIQDLRARVEELETTSEVLKLYLGTAGSRKIRTEHALTLLRGLMMGYLSKEKWAKKEMIRAADDTSSLQESEIAILIDVHGTQALRPFADLMGRMILQVENDPAYPTDGLDTVHQRLAKAKERLAAMLYLCTTTKGFVPKLQAAEALASVETKITNLDNFILNCVLAAA